MTDTPSGIPDPGADAAVTYGTYLKVDELLSLQRPRSDGPEHDEMLFIVIHQVYELWFKQLLHELDYCVELLNRNDGHRALHTLKRVLTILKVQVSQLDVLETMTPLEFLSFRARLQAASGFQSHQFRQLEFVLGMKRSDVVERFPEGSEGRKLLERRLREPGLWQAFLGYLSRAGHPVPAPVLEADASRPVEADPKLHPVLVGVYRGDPMNAQLCERLVDLDEGMQEWRYRHVKMVERTIGSKRGTGGSSGSAYLKTTLGVACFPDLWEIRGAL